MREKLIELLSSIQDEGRAYGADVTAILSNSQIADHLIANGVTVQKKGEWHTLTECSNEGVYCSVCHKKVYKADYAWCNKKNKVRSDFCPHCGADMTKGDSDV